MASNSQKIVIQFKEYDLKKSVAAIHIGGKLSLLQRKMVNVLLHNAFPNLMQQDEHSIRITELARRVGLDKSNNTDVIKSVFRALSGITVEWDILNPSGKKEWGITTLVASARVVDGVCTYQYSKALVEKLYYPEVYAIIDLNIQNFLKSSYSLALYENCLRFKAIGETSTFSVEQWRKLLGADGKMYQDFKYFKKFVLSPAIVEVNESTDIFIEPEFTIVGRKVTDIKFIINFQPENVAHLTAFDFKDKPALESPRAEEVEISLNEDNAQTTVVDETRALLLAFNLSEQQMERVFALRSPEDIKEIAVIVKEHHKKGKIKGALAAYAYTAFKEDFRPKKTPIELEIEAQKAESNRLKAEKEAAILQKKLAQEAAEKAKEEANKKEREEWQSFFNKLSESEQQEINQLAQGSIEKTSFLGELLEAEFAKGIVVFEEMSIAIRVVLIGKRIEIMKERYGKKA